MRPTSLPGRKPFRWQPFSFIPACRNKRSLKYLAGSFCVLPRPWAAISEAQRAKSISDFVSKTEGALQEADESVYWLELIQDSGVMESGKAIEPLQDEARQLLAIFVAITRKAKQTKAQSQAT